MGDMDLVRPLGLARIRSILVYPPGSAAVHSRFVLKDLSWEDSWEDSDTGDEHRIAALMRFGTAQPEKPVLFYQQDAELLLVSRHRKWLAQAFRFVIPEPTLVEDLVDKARFQALAEDLHLPVPSTRLIHPESAQPDEIDLHFPVIIKPLRRTHSWDFVGGSYKALLIEKPDRLHELWPHLMESNTDLLVQEAIQGPENRIESYHVYVDGGGTVAAEFTGRKIRTLPSTCGHSTALETTDAADVAGLGQEIVQKLDLRGVAKLDFKRDPAGDLHLLEINPRFNLWHHLGAVAGVNIPALVYADLAGLPRPPVSKARAGLRWCKPLADLSAARACNMPFHSWLRWVLHCEAKSALAWDDPMPILHGIINKVIQ